MRRCIPALIALACLSPGLAQGSYAIRDAKIVTVSGPTIEKGTVLIQDGVIAGVGENVRIPRGTRRIDGEGLTVYPGLFDSDTQLGLTEIGQVDVSNDYSELGEYMPHLLAFSAIHVESEHIPVARFNGITHVLTRPSSGTFPGQAAVVSLDGWSPEEMEITRHGAMIFSFPGQMGGGFRGFGGFGRGRARSYTEIKREYDEKIAEISGILASARHYRLAKESGNDEYDKKLEALIPVVAGEMPVLVSASSHVDIKNAVEFCEKENLNYILTGASDAWKVAGFLKEHGTRIVLGPRQNLPRSEDDPIDIVYRTPAILHDTGVPFALSTGNSSDVRTLPYEVGNAVAYGLPHDAALRAVTLTPAEFLGIEDRVGSVEQGKKANLVVADGDIFEYQTSVKHLFINGRPVDLSDNKHTKLYQKYINRP